MDIEDGFCFFGRSRQASVLEVGRCLREIAGRELFVVITIIEGGERVGLTLGILPEWLSGVLLNLGILPE